MNSLNRIGLGVFCLALLLGCSSSPKETTENTVAMAQGENGMDADAVGAYDGGSSMADHSAGMADETSMTEAAASSGSSKEQEARKGKKKRGKKKPRRAYKM